MGERTPGKRKVGDRSREIGIDFSILNLVGRITFGTEGFNDVFKRDRQIRATIPVGDRKRLRDQIGYPCKLTFIIPLYILKYIMSIIGLETL
jgi:hypothetical protein